ncbi:HNH endonuclease signature motif containing protein [Corynebacterium pseudodiphtheriticum]|uniref:HNH endonuclease signature motif containing protein n=1 Tax=Corynebacterium pseudodiphtheriticum TaxID=37637 RepID=UPI00254EA22E|nr:HNH endonuclease signature motif containing protein [Corynebacterium pseudodiphtheriticum]MDK8718583.1 HNH endonuclease signature motif containing protein [Corynebacterium pseudodiphtheriticum]
MNADATAYFTHCNPHDEDAQTMLGLRRQEFHAWDSLIDFEHYDYDLLLKELMETTGLSSHKVGDIIGAFYRMTDLPKLRDLATTMWHIDIDRWIAIDRAMVKAGDANAHLFAVIDNLLVEYLTPTKPAQQMPSRRSIINRINREIEAHDSSVRQKQKKNPTRKNYEVHDIPLSSRNDNDTHEFHFDTDAATAVKIDAHVHKHAKTAGISLRDAVVDLLLGNAHTSVTLNCYRANDIADAPLFISTDTGAGVTTLFGAAADNLADKASKHRDMDAAANHEVAGYATTPTMRAAVTGRDGHCRYPGCEEPATICQMDHVIEYDDGGPTTPANLISLCQHHHNIKTDKRARPIFEPATGTVVWLFADGTWQSTEAEGPLAKPNRRWVQTLRQKMACARKAHREEAQKEKRRQEKQSAEQAQQQTQHSTVHGDETESPSDIGSKVSNDVSNDDDINAPVDDPWEQSQQSKKKKTPDKKEPELLTNTQEQQLWHNDLTWLQSALNKWSFNADNMKQFQPQLRAIHARVAGLRESGLSLSTHATMACAMDEFSTMFSPG